jgi:hypothetical protein
MRARAGILMMLAYIPPIPLKELSMAEAITLFTKPG